MLASSAYQPPGPVLISAVSGSFSSELRLFNAWHANWLPLPAINTTAALSTDCTARLMRAVSVGASAI